MKKIIAIVRPEVMEPLKEALSAAGVTGMTIFEAQGFGHQHGWKEYYRGTEVLLNMVPKLVVILVVADEEVDHVIDEVVRVARTGDVGDGKIFVSPVEDAVRIRTGERGDAAL